MENLLRLRILVAVSYVVLAWYVYLVCRFLFRICKDRHFMSFVCEKILLLRQMCYRTLCVAHPDDLLEARVKKILLDRRLDRSRNIRLLFMHLFAPLVVWDSVNATLDGLWGDMSNDQISFYLVIKSFPAFVMLLSFSLVLVEIPCLNTGRTLDILYVLQGLRIIWKVLSTEDTISFVFAFPWLAFLRVCLSWTCGNVAVTTPVNMTICIVHCWAYSRAASVTTDADAKLFPGHVSVYIAREIMVTMMTSAFCWMVESTSDVEVRATLDSKSSVKLATTVQGLLAVLCDVVVHLGEDFRISRPNPHLATFLLSGKSGEAFQGCSFPDLMVGPDGARFREHVAREHHESHAQAFHVDFKGSSNTVVNARLYHGSYENAAGKMEYIVGISEAGTLVDLATEQEVVSQHLPMQLERMTPRVQSMPSDGAESMSSMTSSDIGNLLPNVGGQALANCGKLAFEVTCDAFSPELTILDCDLNFCLLCGLHPGGKNLIEWVKEPREHAVKSWIQAHANARSCESECSDPKHLTVTLQTPFAEELKLQFHADCNLSFPEELQVAPGQQEEESDGSDEDDSEIMPMMRVRLSFTRVRQKCRAGTLRKFSTTMAVSCDLSDSNLLIRRCTLGFSLLCGCHPEGESLLLWIKEPLDFVGLVRSGLNTASKGIGFSGFEMTFQPPLAKQLRVELSTWCTCQVDEDPDNDRSDLRAHLFVRLVFTSVHHHAVSPESDTSSTGSCALPKLIETKPSMRQRRNLTVASSRS